MVSSRSSSSKIGEPGALGARRMGTMFTSFSVSRFRGFKQLELSDLARVNLLVGGNNTGKTALLEALQLFCAPGLVQQGTEQPDHLPLTRQTEMHVSQAELTLGWWFYRQEYAAAV
jgi:predicted ATP-dependent endonuclease of OLD family